MSATCLSTELLPLRAVVVAAVQVASRSGFVFDSYRCCYSLRCMPPHGARLVSCVAWFVITRGAVRCLVDCARCGLVDGWP